MNDVTQQTPNGASGELLENSSMEAITENSEQQASQQSTHQETQPQKIRQETQPQNIQQEAEQKKIRQETQHQMEQILAQTEKVNEQLAKFHKHKFVRAYNSIPRLLWFQLLKGVAFGLGSVLGATVVLSAFVYLLSQIEFIPFIGEWVSEILEVVKTQVPN